MSRSSLLQELAIAGGKAILASMPKDGVVAKEGRGNFVTAADHASEQAILRQLTHAYPNDAILTEESRPDGHDLLNEPRLWVIDPLDGTNNFRFDRPHSAVSIGYVEKGELKAGAVYDPFRDEVFFAECGGGATRNGERIAVSDQESLSAASVATDNCYDPEGTRRNLELFLRIRPSPWLMVRGSAVKSLCEVACGRTDLYFHTALQPWDNAAAFLIVQEAGGILVDLEGRPVNFLSSHVIAANTALVKQCLQCFGTISK